MLNFLCSFGVLQYYVHENMSEPFVAADLYNGPQIFVDCHLHA